MAVFKIEHNKNYTVMSNVHFKEKQMSLKAKGLLSLMLSLPEDWDYSIAGLVAICKENETAIKSTLKELSEFGYLRIDKIYPDKTDTGRIEYVYNVFENPNQDTKKQGVENLPLEIQCVENQVQLNTNKLNTNKLNKKEYNKCVKPVKSKKSKLLENIEKKCLEYDLTDNVIDLVLRFFENLIDNNKLVTNDKINATLHNLAGKSESVQIKAIQLSLDKGYMSINTDWVQSDKNYTNGKSTWVNNPQVFAESKGDEKF